MPLTAELVRDAKPAAKEIKIFDGGGLFLLISTSGGKWWRFRYDFKGKENLLSLGVYPAVGLDEARQKRDEARQLLAQGIDPAIVRREEKSRARAAALQTKDDSPVRVCASIDGTLEISKGRAMMCLTAEEARAVQVLLVKLTT